MGGRTSGERRRGHHLPPPEGRLAFLEHQYAIERKPLETKLQEAIAEQEQLDAFVGRYAREAALWKKLVNQYRRRRDCVVKGEERLSRGARRHPR